MRANLFLLFYKICQNSITWQHCVRYGKRIKALNEKLFETHSKTCVGNKLQRKNLKSK